MTPESKKLCFGATDILLPDFNRVSGTGWAVIACDQFTSEKEYWEAAEKEVGGQPSTLSLMIPEVYLFDDHLGTFFGMAQSDLQIVNGFGVILGFEISKLVP